ncbi:MAG TPA: PIG-L family deacetylase [Chloroflexota bacterium]|nr:PIG-L family deacetylase [Chloroflexota bacterium]
MKRLLVILAHPDDESFPLGGTLARYAAEDVAVTLVCATKGEAGIAGHSAAATAVIREQELQAAAHMLGVSDLRFLGYLDGHVGEVNEETAVTQLITLLQEIQPHAVITFGPDGISGHPDHLAVHRLVTAAFDRAGLESHLYYIAPSEATHQGCGVIPSQEGISGPVAAIDVGDYLVTKVRAMQCHASQHPPFMGNPEEEVSRLVCHEYFTLARPQLADIALTDLFNQPKIFSGGKTFKKTNVVNGTS